MAQFCGESGGWEGQGSGSMGQSEPSKEEGVITGKNGKVSTGYSSNSKVA